MKPLTIGNKGMRNIQVLNNILRTTQNKQLFNLIGKNLFMKHNY